jgi:hypothetical protein
MTAMLSLRLLNIARNLMPEILSMALDITPDARGIMLDVFPVDIPSLSRVIMKVARNIVPDIADIALDVVEYILGIVLDVFPDRVFPDFAGHSFNIALDILPHSFGRVDDLFRRIRNLRGRSFRDIGESQDIVILILHMHVN